VGTSLARPKIEVDWTEIDKLCALQATHDEIAQFLGVSEDTLSRRCKEDHDMSFADYIAQKRGVGRVSLRRSQWLLAQKGNATMLIWLGKQYLGQRDKNSHELSGPDGKPIETHSVGALTDEQIDEKLKNLSLKLELNSTAVTSEESE
jgi:hypothetical protein